jgi:hypothetical protein
MRGEILSTVWSNSSFSFSKFAARTPCGEPAKPEEPLSRKRLFLNSRAAGVNRKSSVEVLGIRLFCAPVGSVSRRDQTIESTMTGQIEKFSQAESLRCLEQCDPFQRSSTSFSGEVLRLCQNQAVGKLPSGTWIASCPASPPPSAVRLCLTEKRSDEFEAAPP